MKLKTILFIAAALTIQSTAFSQINPLVRYLPGDASMVMSFNLLRLAGKIPGESFRQSFIYREMMKDPKMPFNSLLSGMEKSGIDFSTDFILVVSKEATAEKSEPVVHIFGKLLNAELFTATVKGLLKEGGDSIATYGTNRILVTEKGMATGWNNDIFVITSGYGKETKKELYEALSDTTANRDFTLAQIKEKLKKAQRAVCFDLLAPKSQNTFSTNSHFTSLMNTPGDIKIWSSAVSNSMFEKIPQLALFSKLKLFTGKDKTSIINFENGKIVAQNHNYVDDQVAAIYKKYPPLSLNTELTRRLPNGKLLALMCTSFNPEMGNELMKKTGMQELMDSLKGKLPFDLNLARGVFKNNMMLAVLKTDEVIPEDTVAGKMNGIQVFLAIPIADKAKFEELKNTAKRMVDSLKGSDLSGKMLKGFNPAVKYNDEIFVLSLSPEAATALLTNPGNGTAPEWLQAYNQHPMVMSINIKELLALLMGKKSKGKSGDSEKKLLDTFDKLIFYGGDFENESLSTTMEFKFTDQNTNCLKQLFDIMNVMAEGNEKAINQKGTKDIQVDTIKLENIIQEKENHEPPPPAKPKKVIPKKSTSPAIKKND